MKREDVFGVIFCVICIVLLFGLLFYCVDDGEKNRTKPTQEQIQAAQKQQEIWNKAIETMTCPDCGGHLRSNAHVTVPAIEYKCEKCGFSLVQIL